MTISTAILGFLNQEPLSGYDLKRRFQDDLSLHWSGNNNQVYRSLTKLHAEGLVTVAVLTPTRGPTRKVYSITSTGTRALRASLRESPELPQVKHPVLARLEVSELLEDEELVVQLGEYRRLLDDQEALWREKLRRSEEAPGNRAGDDRSCVLRQAIHRRWIDFYAAEIVWTTDLMKGIAERSKGGTP